MGTNIKGTEAGESFHDEEKLIGVRIEISNKDIDEFVRSLKEDGDVCIDTPHVFIWLYREDIPSTAEIMKKEGEKVDKEEGYAK